jgi:hypothetical protein
MRIVSNPVEEIDDLCKKGSFFAGFALAVTYFEYEANSILDGWISKKALKKRGVSSKIDLVFDLGLIEEEIYQKIDEMIRTRNHLIHARDRKIDEQGRPSETEESTTLPGILLRFALTPYEKSQLSSFRDCYMALLKANSAKSQ